MSSNYRFVVNEEHIIDTLNSTNYRRYWLDQDRIDDEKYLRECVLDRRLDDLIAKLIVNRWPKQKLDTGEEYQPANDEAYRVKCAILNVISPSHLNTFDPGMSVQHRPAGKLERQKKGYQNLTSLSLFFDDVELLLRDLYGDVDSEALHRVLLAVFRIDYVREDLHKEHRDAKYFDYMFGIGVPDGYCINGSDWRRGMLAKSDLILRVCEVLANPSAFSEYTVEFAKLFNQDWVCSLDTAYEARNPRWRKLRAL